MKTKVYIIKRKLRSKQENGRFKTRYALRWQDPLTGKWQCENCDSNDKTKVDSIRDQKWAELNIPGMAPPAEPEPPAPAATWNECREAFRRAMVADNLRSGYIASATLIFDDLHREFPDVKRPADLTADLANEYKRRRAESTEKKSAVSPWTIKGNIATLRAVFGKWLGKECGLLKPDANPFANVRAPKCDDPEIRIVAAEESDALFAWMSDRWPGWKLPGVYLDVAAWLGWRATETASIRVEDILPDGFVRVAAKTSKTRKIKHGHLPKDLHDALKACAAEGWAFGRFAPELQRQLLVTRKAPNHAARVKEFVPKRLVGWMQDELQRFNADQAKAAAAARPKRAWEPFTLHDFRRTAITGMQMAGVTEKEASIAVGATPEVMRKHYEKLDQLAIARRLTDRRVAMSGEMTPRSLRARCARVVDDQGQKSQTVTA